MSVEVGKQKAEICASNASDLWNVEARKAFLRFARTRRTFTTGDVRRWLQEKKQIFPHDGRAWGAIAAAMRREGVISPTGRFIYSGSHGRPDSLWSSNLLK